MFFENQELQKIIIEIKPDYFIKGAEAQKEEQEAAESYGGKVIIIPPIQEISSTHIINKAKNLQ